jgi:hypothetical protein
MSMLKISKYQKAIVFSVIAAVSLTGFAQSANAEANSSNSSGSNSSGSNVTGTITTGSSGNGFTGGRSGFSSGTISRAGALNSNISLKQGAYNTAAQNLAAAEAATPQASDTTPVRFARQALDAASCGCPNADTNPTASTATPRPELVAARAAEAQAAAELAAAKAEARQFLESVKGEATASNSSTTSVLW